MFDPNTIINTLGLIGVYSIIFAESGLFFGFFFPGDTLLFASGIFASQGAFSILVLIIGSSISAILGDNVGYWTGKKVGPKLFEKEDSFFFSKKRVHQAQAFYEKFGPITIVLARFIPMIRTFAPIVAGVAGMHYRKFVIYNIVGGILWVASVSLLGYYFGSLIPNIDAFLMPIFALVIIFSFAPFIVKFIYQFLKK